MKKHDKILKKAEQKFVEGEDNNDMLIVMVHERHASCDGKRIDYTNIKTQAQWDEAKRKAGFSPKPFKKIFDLWIAGDNYEEDCRIWDNIKNNFIL